MKEEVNQAARAVAAMVVTPHKPLTVPISSLATLPRKEEPMSTTKVRLRGIKPMIAAILAANPEGMTAHQVLIAVKAKEPNAGRWTTQNVWNHLSTMRSRNEAKNLNERWYKGDKEPATSPRRRRRRAVSMAIPAKANGSHAPSAIKLDGFDPDAAIAAVKLGLEAAVKLGEWAKRTKAQAELHDQQNGKRLAAILKLASDGAL